MYLPDYINLKSYSSSPGYCGYFSYPKRDFKRAAKVAIKTVFSVLDAEKKGAIKIYSSLHTGCSDSELIEKYKYAPKDIGLFLNQAVNCAPPIVLRRDNDLDDFTVIPYSYAVEGGLYGACYTVIALGGLRGHLFIHFEDRGFCVYPHDDVGFGVISLDPHNTLAQSFMDSIDTSEFEVIKRHRGI